jgi:ribosome biogenesis protein ENP2
VSNDGFYMVASGVYPPRIKIFETQEMSVKCERGIDAEVLKLSILSDDYTKIAMLLHDRYIELHAQYGRHFRIRVPKVGRDMTYMPNTCDLVTVGATNEIYRLNLEQGRFLAPLESDSEEINCVAYNSTLHCIATGGIDGVVEMWSMDERQKILELPVKGHKAFENYDMSEITALSFSDDGMYLAIGNEVGKVKLFDIRYPVPIFEKQHQYKLPIMNVKFHEKSRTVFSQDKKIIKIYERDTGNLYTNIQPKKEINDFAVYKDSGLVFTAGEQEKIGSYFIPSIGTAPKWCSYIENMTEEMEEKKLSTTSEDYKFLTKNDLEQLNATHLVGSKMVKPYMHGFFMDIRQYQKLKSVSDPFAYEKYRKKKIDDKLDELRDNRIVFQRSLPKVNSQFAKDLIKADKKRLRKERHVDRPDKKDPESGILADDRFSKMFKDSDYNIDSNHASYKINKPVRARQNDDSSEDEQDPTALQNILGDTVKPKDKQKDMSSRVTQKTKARNMERITPIAEFKRKDGQTTALERRTDRKQKLNEGKRILNPQELKEKQKTRRVAIPIDRIQKY